MRLTIVGCAGSFPNASSPCSSYLVESDGYRLLLDMGNGSLGALQRHIGLQDIDAFFISHLHGDHCLDACVYAVARRYAPDGRFEPLPMFGPPGTVSRLAAAADVNGLEGPLDDVYAEQVLRPGTFEAGPFRLAVDRVNHPVETYAVRVSHGGRSLTYSADTGVSDALVDLARGTDVLLCEATFDSDQPNPPNLHLTGADAGRHAARAGAGRLLLTHLTAWSDAQRTLAEARSSYDGDAVVVASGEQYDI
ncbi:MAG: MBL fold metallo-hydrolase [Mycobacteriales bacterium]